MHERCAHMSASFLEAANVRKRHTTSAVLLAAARRDPPRMADATRRWFANFQQHQPDHFYHIWTKAENRFRRIPNAREREQYALYHMISQFGTSGYFDFAIYPMRGIIHALNRITLWIFRAQLRVRGRARERRAWEARIRQGKANLEALSAGD